MKPLWQSYQHWKSSGSPNPISDITSFRTFPTTTAEHTANKKHDASLWKPRDVLIASLRAIDNKVAKPNSLIVISADSKTNEIRWFISSPSRLFTLGMLIYTLVRSS